MAIIAHCALNVIVYNSSRIKIFNLEGGKYGSNTDTKWYMTCWDEATNGYVNCETPIFPATAQVESVIGYYESKDPGIQVEYVAISNTVAIALFLQGTLTIEHFKNARSAHGHIILDNVLFCGGYYSVLIRDEQHLQEHIDVIASNEAVA